MPIESKLKLISMGNLPTHPPPSQQQTNFFAGETSSLAMILPLPWDIFQETDMSLCSGCRKSINEIKGCNEEGGGREMSTESQPCSR